MALAHHDTAPPRDAPRLSSWQKIAYGVGDVALAIRMTSSQFHLLPLYTDVVLLPAVLAGLGRAAGLVWDAVNDPVTGYLSDRTRSRFGRRRPFLVATAVPMGVTFAFLFSPPAGLGVLSGFLFMVLAFALLDTFYTLYSTPYLALGAELTRDYHERTQLSATRSFFHILGLFAGGVVPAVLVERAMKGGGAAADGYALAGMILGGVMVTVALVTGLSLRELPPPPESGRIGWRPFVAGMRSTLANRPFRVMLGTFFLILLAGGINQMAMPYAFRYWLGAPDLIGSVVGIYLLASVASLPLWTWLAGRYGKDVALRCCIGWAVFVLGLLPVVFTPGMGFLRAAGMLVLAGIGNGGWAVIPVAITADIVDHDEVDSHARREGAFFGVWTLSMKLATATAAGVIGVVLQVVGYVANVDQTPAAVLGIRLLYGAVPAVIMLVALAVFWRFPLTRERHREIQTVLAARRRDAALRPRPS
jgi:GPH family glycoside/pentoside/hexuronide:cation symporter